MGSSSGAAVGAAGCWATRTCGAATSGSFGVGAWWWAPNVNPSTNAAAAAASTAARRRRTAVAGGGTASHDDRAAGSRVLGRLELASGDQLDPVAIWILDEADAADLGAAARREGWLLRLDADLRELGEHAVEVVDRECDVVVAVAEVVGLVAPDVDRQLERVGVVGQPHV